MFEYHKRQGYTVVGLKVSKKNGSFSTLFQSGNRIDLRIHKHNGDVLSQRKQKKNRLTGIHAISALLHLNFGWTNECTN